MGAKVVKVHDEDVDEVPRVVAEVAGMAKRGWEQNAGMGRRESGYGNAMRARVDARAAMGTQS